MNNQYREKWAKVDGFQTRYIDEGTGKPILFLHGLGGRIESDISCYPYLTRHFRVIAFDQPGSGYCDKLTKRYDLEYLTSFIFKFADKLKLKNFYICGGSQGGLLTLLSAIKHPNRVIKISIYSPSGVWGKNIFLTNLFKILPSRAGRLFLHIVSHFWYSDSYRYKKGALQDDIKFIDSQKMPGFGMHVLGMLISVFEKDRRPLFQKIKTPTLIFWGKKDYGQPITQGRYLAKIIKNSRLIEVSNTGHMMSTERPKFYAMETENFFNS